MLYLYVFVFVFVCLIKDGHTGNIIKARGVDRHVGGGCGATGEYGEVRPVCMFFCDTLYLAFGRVAQPAACPHWPILSLKRVWCFFCDIRGKMPKIKVLGAKQLFSF